MRGDGLSSVRGWAISRLAIVALALLLPLGCSSVVCPEGSPLIELKVTFSGVDTQAAELLEFDAVLETSGGYRVRRIVAQALPDAARDGAATFLIDPGRLFWSLAREPEEQREFTLHLRVRLLGRAESGARRLLAEGIWQRTLRADGCYLSQQVELTTEPVCDHKHDGADCVAADGQAGVCRCVEPSAGCGPEEGTAGLACEVSTCGDGYVDRAAGELCEPTLSAMGCGSGCIVTPLRLSFDAVELPAIDQAPGITSGSAAGQEAQANGFFELVQVEQEPDDPVGAGVVHAADLDGDGEPELAIGYPGGRRDGSTSTRTGKVYVVEGWVGQMHLGDVADAKLTLVGPDEMDDPKPYWLGAALASGDLDGDGSRDLVVGAPLRDSGTQQQAGAVVILRGGPDGALSAADDGLQIEVDSSDDEDLYRLVTGPEGSDASTLGSHFGYALAAADFNGDGYADLAVGAPDESLPGAPSVGAVYLLPGGPAGWEAGVERSVIDLDVRVLRGARPGSRTGVSLAVGDLDRDGVPDLLIGAEASGTQAHGEAHVLFGSPELFEVLAAEGDMDTLSGSGAPALMALRIPSGASGRRGLGGRLAVADVDDDGLPELAVTIGRRGSEESPRAVLLIPGSAVSSFRAGGAAPDAETVGLLLEGTPSDAFGAALVARDVSGDHRADLIIGAPLATADASGAPEQAGATFVLFSSPLSAPVGSGTLDASEIFSEPATDDSYGWLKIEGAHPHGQLGAALGSCDSVWQSTSSRYEPLLLLLEPGWSQDSGLPAQGRLTSAYVTRFLPCGDLLPCTEEAAEPW